MPARRMYQKSENRERFRQLIRGKIAREKENMKIQIDEELPSWISWVLKPVASIVFDVQRARDSSKGEKGEDSAFFNLWLFLPNTWIIINDVVLEPKPDEFIQLDHILIGPPGIFLVETKAWDGAFLAHNDNWKRKEGNRWVRCSSPTRQSLRHYKLFASWIKERLDNETPGNLEDWIFPNVLFTQARWLRTKDCSVPVFEGATAFAWQIRKQTKIKRLSPDLVDKVARNIAEAMPYERLTDTAGAERGIAYKESSEGTVNQTELRFFTDETKPEKSWEKNKTGIRIEESCTKQGRAFVKIYGSQEDALKIHREYQEKGRHPTACKTDRYAKGAWYFYLE